MHEDGDSPKSLHSCPDYQTLNRDTEKSKGRFEDVLVPGSSPVSSQNEIELYDGGPKSVAPNYPFVDNTVVGV